MQTLYKLDFADGKSYIGITSRSVAVRFGCHRRDALSNSNKEVHEAWRRLGAPTLVVLATVEDNMRDEAERAAIAEHGTFTPGGYNHTTGGSHGSRCSEAGRERNRAAQVGHVVTPEARQKIGEANKRRVISQETRERLRAAQTGKVASPETLAKMSAAAKAVAARASAGRENDA